MITHKYKYKHKYKYNNVGKKNKKHSSQKYASKKNGNIKGKATAWLNHSYLYHKIGQLSTVVINHPKQSVPGENNNDMIANGSNDIGGNNKYYDDGGIMAL